MHYRGERDVFLGPLLRGVRATAQERECNLLLACGIGLPAFDTPLPAWPVPAPGSDSVPVGPWNTDGLLVVPPSCRRRDRAMCIRLPPQATPWPLAGVVRAGRWSGPTRRRVFARRWTT
jgi:hypothetical protein